MSAVLNPPLTHHRFSREQYERMIEAGVFGPEDRLELLDGEIIDMAPQKSRHATAIRLSEEARRTAGGNGVEVRGQRPLCRDARAAPDPPGILADASRIRPG